MKTLPIIAVAAAFALAALLFIGSGQTFQLSTALAQSPPGTPSSVTVTRADGSLTANWQAVSGATSYHITYTSDNGASWSLAAFDHPNSSITINNADNSETYVVGVRARNEHGGSGWRNSAPAGPFTPPTPTPTPTATNTPTPTATNTPTPSPPTTPSSVTVTRADGTLTASWQAVSGATSYHITYTSNNGASWSLAAFDHPNSSITISNADNSKTYVVGVRARNEHGGSGWRNSAPAGPFTPPTPTPTPTATNTPTPTATNTPTPSPPTTPSSVTVTRADGTLTASWQAVSGATSYHITYTSNNGASWSLAAFDHPNSSITISNADNSKTYVVGVRARNEHGGSGWRNSAPAGPFTPPTPTPTPTPTDREALVALYNATDGANWNDNTNWLSDKPLGQWYGIRTDHEGRVTTLYLAENNLTGTIPTELGQMGRVHTLSLGDNELNGTIPPELGNLTNLEFMHIYDTQLSGTVPPEFGNLSNLKSLVLRDNKLTGALPSELTNLTKVFGLHFGGNDGLCAPANVVFHVWFTQIRANADKDRHGPSYGGHHGPNCDEDLN